ncbi:putative exported protein, partial [Ehrlichia ruminantium]
FESNRSGNVLRDIGLGFEYNLLKDLNKMKCKLFGNYHYYDFSEAAIIDKVVYNHEVAVYSAQPQTELQRLGYSTREKSEKLKSGSGNVFLVGVKLEF